MIKNLSKNKIIIFLILLIGFITCFIFHLFNIYETNKTKQNIFVNCPNMNIGRAMHTATLMKDGNVLIVGGSAEVDEKALKTAEIYNPQLNKFILLKNKTNVEHSGSKSFLLKNGKVAIVGRNGIEIFDPTTNKFKLVNKMLKPRYNFNAILINDDKILIYGGTIHDTNPYQEEAIQLINSEIYTIKTNKISSTKPIYYSIPILLKKEEYYEANSEASKYENLIFDPSSNKLFEIIVIPLGLNDPICTAIMLNNKKILIIMDSLSPMGSGYSFIYDPSSNKIYKTLNNKRTIYNLKIYPKTLEPFKSILLKNGNVLLLDDWLSNKILTGMSANSKADIYNPKLNKFFPVGRMFKKRFEYTATVLKNGNVLITGGINYNLTHIDKKVAKTTELFISEK